MHSTGHGCGFGIPFEPLLCAAHEVPDVGRCPVKVVTLPE
jgi:hypothetical protein